MHLTAVEQESYPGRTHTSARRSAGLSGKRPAGGLESGQYAPEWLSIAFTVFTAITRSEIIDQFST